MTLPHHNLCKHISDMNGNGNMRNQNDTSIKSFSNRMTIHLDMLRTLMVDRISSNLNGTYVINR